MCRSLVEGRHKLPVGKNLFLEIRRLIFASMIMMDQNEARGSGFRIQDHIPDQPSVARLCRNWHHEVEETLVHIFDFQYFYGKDVGAYVSEIWASWGTVPTVATCIHEYVVRTPDRSHVRSIFAAPTRPLISPAIWFSLSCGRCRHPAMGAGTSTKASPKSSKIGPR